MDGSEKTPEKEDISQLREYGFMQMVFKIFSSDPVETNKMIEERVKSEIQKSEYQSGAD